MAIDEGPSEQILTSKNQMCLTCKLMSLEPILICKNMDVCNAMCSMTSLHKVSFQALEPF